MAIKFAGGCLCGCVRYECSADPIFMGNCHCRDCQKSSGGAYEPDIGLPAGALKITVRSSITTPKRTVVIR